VATPETKISISFSSAPSPSLIARISALQLNEGIKDIWSGKAQQSLRRKHDRNFPYLADVRSYLRGFAASVANALTRSDHQS
jgi:hypothetical protein